MKTKILLNLKYFFITKYALITKKITNYQLINNNKNNIIISVKCL